MTLVWILLGLLVLWLAVIVVRPCNFKPLSHGKDGSGEFPGR